MQKTILFLLLVSLSGIALEAGAAWPAILKYDHKVYLAHQDRNFLFGAEELGSTGKRMIFNESTGAFAAGSNSVGHSLGELAIDLGVDNNVSGDGSVAIGHSISATTEKSFNLGHGLTSSADNNLSFGVDISNSGTNTIAIGSAYGSGSDLNASESNSLYLGMISAEPTVYVSPASGGASFGSVGIATSEPNSNVAIDVNGAMRVGVLSSLPTCDEDFQGTLVLLNGSYYFQTCSCRDGEPCQWYSIDHEVPLTLPGDDPEA